MMKILISKIDIKFKYDFCRTIESLFLWHLSRYEPKQEEGQKASVIHEFAIHLSFGHPFNR